MNQFLPLVYHLIVAICFCLSLLLSLIKYKNHNKQNYIIVYFLSVIVLDFGYKYFYFLSKINQIRYFFFVLLAILYFAYFFIKNIQQVWLQKTIKIIAATAITVAAIYQISSGHFLHTVTPVFVVYAMFNIVVALLWLYQIFNKPTVGYKIYQYQAFWVASGLLCWSVFFIFRVGAMQYFNHNDLAFLRSLQNIFSLINCLTYLLFIKGLLSKA